MPGDTTLRPTRAASAARKDELWLTIAWHPDRRRVGESVRVADRTRISRLEPEFPGGPIADKHVSRTPVLLEVGERGVTLSGPDLVQTPLGRGTLVTLADRVALWLERRPEPGTSDGLVGISSAIDQLRREVDALAAVDHPVLVLGETGTGKELVARRLHERGPRAAAPFLAINMATLTPSTAPAQLFGHVRGAFTGADRAASGVFASADGGTLFLDEVFDTPSETQAMLLRALDGGEILPVGGDALRRVDVRVVAATDGDLAGERFRPQLHQRLASHTLTVPPLRERAVDVGPLLAHFLDDDVDAPASLVRAWMAYPWPGNVREVRNLARRWAVAAKSGAPLEAPVGIAPAPEPADDARILAALEEHDWAPGAAAKALGVSKTTVYAWIERSPQVRTARDIPRDELDRALADAGDDTAAAARLLKVSHRGLQLRLRELGRT